MPKIAEIKEIDGEIWVRIGKLENHESGIAIWTQEEQMKNYREGYDDGFSDAQGN